MSFWGFIYVFSRFEDCFGIRFFDLLHCCRLFPLMLSMRALFYLNPSIPYFFNLDIYIERCGCGIQSIWYWCWRPFSSKVFQELGFRCYVFFFFVKSLFLRRHNNWIQGGFLSIVQLIFLHCSCGKCGLWNVAIDQILCTCEISLGVLRGEGFPRGETLKSGYTHCLPQPTSPLPLPPLSQQQTNETYPRPPARQLGNMASASFFFW